MKSPRRIVIAAVAVLCLSPAAAQAAERQISPAASDLTADGGWVSFLTDNGRVAGRGDAFRAVPPMAGLELGTDAKGRAVGLFDVCGRRGRCTLRERLMANRRERVMSRYRRRQNTGIRADRHNGISVITRSGIRRGRRKSAIEVRRRGRRTLRRIEDGGVMGLDAGAGRVLVSLFRGHEVVVREITVGRRGLSARTIAVDSLFDEDCKCMSSSTRLESLSADGRYAYWIEVHTRTEGGDFPLGHGYPSSSSARIVRADLRARPQRNEAIDLPRRSHEIAVDRGRILYTGYDTPGLYEMRDAVWQPVGTGRRNVGVVPASG